MSAINGERARAPEREVKNEASTVSYWPGPGTLASRVWGSAGRSAFDEKPLAPGWPGHRARASSSIRDSAYVSCAPGPGVCGITKRACALSVRCMMPHSGADAYRCCFSRGSESPYCAGPGLSGSGEPSNGICRKRGSVVPKWPIR
eukprot:1326072-Prymnesium_polylepis.1